MLVLAKNASTIKPGRFSTVDKNNDKALTTYTKPHSTIVSNTIVTILINQLLFKNTLAK
ncbi:hypothetical protein HOT02_gp147 [Staphylococcus phage phiSA_BS2]|uniref:Uncharacterized protein n=1 Tax=Staphylococcus phage phiSA_BS2 TaxID=2126724 RepID=A0A2R3ZXV1_9CAUD|nr:hypothetical protein HOT02_gp147 [Staphylococcus phage phiSA_BS2]AVR55591.1 hypothetical protein phiSABS2_147 [Staphylococcus phage phiSA_BS2]